MFNPEEKLLLTLLRSPVDYPEITELIKCGIDWDKLLLLAADHRVLPTIYKRLKSQFSEIVPVSSLLRFKASNQQNTKANFARSGQLIKLLSKLKAESIPVIAYKGMALASFAFGDSSLRQYGDIDLFVKKTDFQRVKAAMVSAGCSPAWKLDGSQEAAVLKHHYEFPFEYGDNKTLIEVHWDFMESFFAFDFDVEGVWDRVETVDLYGHKVKTLSPEDYLLVLASHGGKHFWKRISWIQDISQIIENKAINWNEVIDRGIETDSLRMVMIGCYLASRTFGTSLNTRVEEKISADNLTRDLGSWFFESMFSEEREPSEWRKMAAVHLKLRERYRTKLKYCLGLLSTKAIDSLFMPMGRPR
ncbi:MAG: nucleotidyltransferase family protein [Pyrinomonadaceae bacterium]|nr:nucleotidyltransferase family protein [Pyrinomonadaceae bacterium]